MHSSTNHNFPLTTYVDQTVATISPTLMTASTSTALEQAIACSQAEKLTQLFH